jgi:parallel beta-helix repeat protein
VTQSGGGNRGMVIDANNVKIRGNQFVPVLAGSIGIGVQMVDSPGTVALEANQVVGWATGILMRGPNKTVRKNVVMENGAGIFTSAGSTVSGNVVIGNGEGIRLVAGATIVTGNAVMNNSFGITNMNVGPPGTGAAFTGTISKNNILGNSCGVTNDGVIGLAADDNYWGAATGPGPDPADDVCNSSGGTTIVTTFATTPFKVKPPIKP